MNRWNGAAGLGLLAALTVAVAALAEVTVVDNGKARAVICVPAGLMETNRPVAPTATDPEKKAEDNRRLLRDSVRDLKDYVQKLSGASLNVVEGAPREAGPDVPILIGELADQAFGPVKTKAFGKQGFRVTVTPEGVGLSGESPLAVTYAIYDVLDRWGCRWFMPGDLGEVVPERKSLSLPEMNLDSRPFTDFRTIWYAGQDPHFKRRNRQGGVFLEAMQRMESWITAEQRDAHPEWRAVVNGKPHPVKLKWTREDVAEAIASNILATLDKNYRPSVTLSPVDGTGWDESEDPKYDAGDWDPAMGVTSKTDRLLILCNRVAERVTKKYPEVILGMLAYVDYTRPPVREKVHPNVIPQFAPITFNRAHPMTWAGHPNGFAIKEMLEGWAKVSPRMAARWYAFNLAETFAPNPFITKWSIDTPICLKNNGTFWMPETMPNFETTMPAIWLGMRLSWNPDQKPEAIIDDMMTAFYGHAAGSMKAYWAHIDTAWIESRQFAGNAFGYLRIFTPDVMAEARRLMDEAVASCRTIPEYRRVAIADESLRLFERYMKLRRDWADGHFQTIGTDTDAWKGAALFLQDKYATNGCFGMPVYFNYFCHFSEPSYRDAARIQKDFVKVTAKPLREWKYRADTNNTAKAQGWSAPGYDDRDWPVCDVALDTWSHMGFHNYMGGMMYRSSLVIPKDIPPGKKIYLWIAATDGSAMVYWNGKPVPTINAKGESVEAADGYCAPFSFDITDRIVPGAPNAVAIYGVRSELNELGSGGLMGPVLLYREK